MAAAELEAMGPSFVAAKKTAVVRDEGEVEAER